MTMGQPRRNGLRLTTSFTPVLILKSRAMPPKSRAAPAKLTAAQLAKLDVIDLCSSSSEDEVEVAVPHAALEPLVEPLRLQPAHCADEATSSSDGDTKYFQYQ